MSFHVTLHDTTHIARTPRVTVMRWYEVRAHALAAAHCVCGVRLMTGMANADRRWIQNKLFRLNYIM